MERVTAETGVWGSSRGQGSGWVMAEQVMDSH